MSREERPREEPTELFRTLRWEIGDVLGNAGELHMTSLTWCDWFLYDLNISIMEPVFDPCTYLDLGIREATMAPIKITPELREKLQKVVSIFR
ncbi:MAG: hypothetical protein FJ044_05695, partial [Candidatus Cloacimonetes bacterium]|nr:hypothetical protein [Candidatus Cloacimonadota bacterium]